MCGKEDAADVIKDFILCFSSRQIVYPLELPHIILFLIL